MRLLTPLCSAVLLAMACTSHADAMSMTEAIQKSFFDIVEGRVEDRYGWLTPVHAVVAAART